MVFAKYPRAGQVKTRLVPPLTPEGACALYRAFLLDALDQYAGFRADGIQPVLYVANADDIDAMRELLGDTREGAAGWLIRPQHPGTLGDRLESAFAEAVADGCPRACAIGTDHPTLPGEYVKAAFEVLDSNDAVIGPAEDGGYYLLATSGLRPELLRGMPYSTPALCGALLAAAQVAGLAVEELPMWYDVDDAESLARLLAERSRLAPDGRTMGVLETVTAGIALPAPGDEAGA